MENLSIMYEGGLTCEMMGDWNAFRKNRYTVWVTLAQVFVNTLHCRDKAPEAWL